MGTRTSLSSDYGFVALWLVITGLGLGLAMTRTMAAAVNSLSKERSGVGSAVVSALRQVGGAVGVAVLGTIANASYRSHLTLPGLPDEAKEAARRSVGAGVAVGEQLGSPAVVRSVQDAFVHAMQSLLAVCGGIAVVAAVLALLFMPKRQPGTEPHDGGSEQEPSALRKAA